MPDHFFTAEIVPQTLCGKIDGKFVALNHRFGFIDINQKYNCTAPEVHQLGIGPEFDLRSVWESFYQPNIHFFKPSLPFAGFQVVEDDLQKVSGKARVSFEIEGNVFRQFMYMLELNRKQEELGLQAWMVLGLVAGNHVLESNEYSCPSETKRYVGGLNVIATEYFPPKDDNHFDLPYYQLIWKLVHQPKVATKWKKIMGSPLRLKHVS